MLEDESLDLSIGTNLLSWSVFVSDGMDTVLSDDSTRYLTLAIEQLGTEFPKIQPERFSLNQNYPNPFNPSTTIRYDLPEDSFVTIKVYDMVGRHVKTLLNNKMSAGRRSIVWDSTNNFDQPVSAGTYFYTIRTDRYSQTKKMILLK